MQNSLVALFRPGGYCWLVTSLGSGAFGRFCDFLAFLQVLLNSLNSCALTQLNCAAYSGSRQVLSIEAPPSEIRDARPA